MKKLLITTLLFIIISSMGKAQEIFIKIIDAQNNPIEGESTAAGYANQIIASSFGQENISCTTIAGGVACPTKAGNFSFNMDINKSLPLLKKAMFTGSVLKSVDIVFVILSTHPFEFYKIRLENVIITHITDAGGGYGVQNQVSIDAGKIGWTYNYQKTNGSTEVVKFGWDAVLNVPWTGF